MRSLISPPRMSGPGQSDHCEIAPAMQKDADRKAQEYRPDARRSTETKHPLQLTIAACLPPHKSGEGPICLADHPDYRFCLPGQSPRIDKSIQYQAESGRLRSSSRKFQRSGLRLA